MESTRFGPRRSVRAISPGRRPRGVRGSDLPRDRGPVDHQQGSAVDPLVRLLDQRLQGMFPCLRILLRPAHPRVPRVRYGSGLRTADRRQDQCGRALPGRDEPARWAGESIAMGTNTDPYQAAEGKYKLTQGIIKVLAERGNGFSILTKSPLVLRDLDLIAGAARAAEVPCLSRWQRSTRMSGAGLSRGRHIPGSASMRSPVAGCWCQRRSDGGPGPARNLRFPEQVSAVKQAALEAAPSGSTRSSSTSGACALISQLARRGQPGTRLAL